MQPHRWDEIKKLLTEAAEQDSAGRDAWLHARCGGDPQLYADVRSLLQEQDDEALLQVPDPERIAHFMREHRAESGVGRQIGKFKVIAVLGYGGMGVVYRAAQEHPHREVALKIIPSGVYASPYQLKLFRREVQSLARMQHAGIAALYEAGSAEDGQHYFAMEFVQGLPLLDYADELQLGLPQRLELFTRICDAVHYAHQKGVIHRDIKPTNILVDEGGQPKLLDFGLAKLTEHDSITVSTALGKLHGTLSYMSPEQARGSSSEIDVRSDVYSLGVVLFELLTQRRPFDLASRTVPQALDVICNETPLKAGTITAILRGDLETIIAKALEKDPQRRYQSAHALAEDIERFLNQQPITARPPSAIYQVRKLIARHKVPVGLAVALMVFLAGSAIGMSVLYARAQREASIATNISDVLTTMLESATPSAERDNDYSVREMLNDFSRRLSSDTFVDPESEARVRTTLAITYTGLGDYASAGHHYDRALDIRRELGGKNNRLYLSLLFNNGWYHHDVGQFERAADIFQECLTKYQRHHSNDKAAIGEIMYSLADTETHLKQFDRAREHAVRALSILRETSPKQPSMLPMALIILADVEYELGYFEDSLQRLREAVFIVDRDSSLFLLRHLAHRELGKVLIALNQPEEAVKELSETLEAYQRCMPPTHEYIGVTHLHLGQALLALQDPAAARPHLEDAARILETHENEKELVEKSRALLNQLKDEPDLADSAIPSTPDGSSVDNRNPPANQP